MDYYSATTNSYDDDSRHDHSMWSPHYASTTASSSRSSDSSYPSDDESGSTHYYASGADTKGDYSESSQLSLFARTLKEQDDLFYSTFPDARPANYQFLFAFPPGSFLTASPTETVALTDIPVTPPNHSHYDYHASATRPLLSPSDVHNDPIAYSTLCRATGHSDHDPSQLTAATSLETSAASPLSSPPALVPSQRQADIPMPMDTSPSLQESAHMNERIDLPRKEPAATNHPLLQVSTQDANLIASSPSHTVSPPDTPPTPTHGFPTESGRDESKDLRLAVAGQYPWPYSQRHLVPLLSTDAKLEAARAYPSPPDSRVEDRTVVAGAVSTKHASSAPSRSPSVPANDVGPPKLVSTRSPRRLGNRKPVLACLFCRGRKIACGPPVPGGPDNACNQCQRRSLKCEFPCENRRSARKVAKTTKSRSESENS